ncbi:TetR/AcrR family transcriptional regulator [Bacillus sp. BRMEA1]|uniref:TetR/AcrR family transcriptional regulator n=1 Tax=Neobacillus endophyticus TaxID=2738405 RepID=UPI001563833D|nr:TetR/AcrR family transcriptional regulator [Neobacillus endophyticus]NRD76226.1 TetR/AcrR family transcriptional regulator [Neobacillus endophyticus]
MNDRKQHVINKAHQLFIDKGFQATSIQDILEYSGISKGTFYNYFSSKSELLMAIFKSLRKDIDNQVNELLIGQNRSDIGIFIKQIELQMKANRKYKLMALFEEVFVSNDEALKEFMKAGHLLHLRWVFQRFLDIFGEEKKPYLLDCSIMFLGILHLNLKYHFQMNESRINVPKVVRYSVERIVKIVEEVSKADEQLIDPKILEKWLPGSMKTAHAIHEKIYHTILGLKKAVMNHSEHAKFTELLDFIQNEITQAKEPRKFLIQSALLSLSTHQDPCWQKGIAKLEELINGL